MKGKRVLMSQGEVRPGVVQGQHWREISQGQRSVIGPDGDRIPVYVIGERPTPRSQADPRLANRMLR